MPGGSSVRSLFWRFLKGTRDQIEKYTGLAQSHGSLPSTTRELWLELPQLESCMANLKKINCSSSFIHQRLHLAISCWAKVNEETRLKISSSRKERGREGTKDVSTINKKYVQFFQQSQGVEYAGRQLCQVVRIEVSESKKRWKRSNSQGWLNLTPHCPPLLLELWLELPHLESCMAKSSKKIDRSSSFIEQRPYLTISCWAKMDEETWWKYQARGRRVETKDASVTNENTYKRVSKVRESKMPVGSSIRSLVSRSLKATRYEIDQIVRVGSISRPIAHHH